MAVPFSVSRYAMTSRISSADSVGRRRHRRRRADLELAQVGFVEREQPLLVVDDLHGVGVFVEAAAADRLAVRRDDANGTIDRQHGARRIEQRSLERRRRPTAPMSLRSGAVARAGAVDAMARRAGALARKQRLAARGIADLHGRAADVEAGADERDQRRRLRPAAA